MYVYMYMGIVSQFKILSNYFLTNFWVIVTIFFSIEHWLIIHYISISMLFLNFRFWRCTACSENIWEVSVIEICLIVQTKVWWGRVDTCIWLYSTHDLCKRNVIISIWNSLRIVFNLYIYTVVFLKNAIPDPSSSMWLIKLNAFCE